LCGSRQITAHPIPILFPVYCSRRTASSGSKCFDSFIQTILLDKTFQNHPDGVSRAMWNSAVTESPQHAQPDTASCLIRWPKILGRKPHQIADAWEGALFGKSRALNINIWAVCPTLLVLSGCPESRLSHTVSHLTAYFDMFLTQYSSGCRLG
jgi:hypothetical protein